MYKEIVLHKFDTNNCTFFRFTEMEKMVKPLYFCFWLYFGPERRDQLFDCVGREGWGIATIVNASKRTK